MSQLCASACAKLRSPASVFFQLWKRMLPTYMLDGPLKRSSLVIVCVWSAAAPMITLKVEPAG